MIFAFRLMIEWKLLNTQPPKSIMYEGNTPDERLFWIYMMNYWHGLPLDDFNSWTSIDKEYFFQHCGRDIFNDSREMQILAYNEYMHHLRESPYAKELVPLLDDLEEYLFWKSVVSTRNHALDFE